MSTTNQRKICMLGAPGVGKTSLVHRFIHSIFSERFASTIGVKISSKSLVVDGKQTSLAIWDLAGEDEFSQVSDRYFRGAGGLFLVADGTRPQTIATCVALAARAEKLGGVLPAVICLNKVDLAEQWAVTPEILAELKVHDWTVFQTSAKSGDQVEAAFAELARKTT